MRLRDWLTSFLLGITMTKILIYLGWTEVTHPAAAIIACVVMIALVHGVGWLSDHFAISRRESG